MTNWRCAESIQLSGRRGQLHDLVPRTINGHLKLDARRRRVRCKLLLRLALALLASISFTESASAQSGFSSIISTRVGAFQPWRGDPGVEIAASVISDLRRVGKPNLRLGAELGYREFQGEIFNVSDVDVRSYRIGLLFQSVFFREFFAQPYVGVKLGFGFNDIDEDAIEDERPELDVGSMGTAFALTATAGFEIPIGPRFMLFAEANASGELQVTGERDGEEVDQVGGVGGQLGVRMIF